MSLGVSLFLIAAGAILRYAISWDPEGVSVPTVGLILMVVGIIGFIVSVFYMVVYAGRNVERR